MTMDTKVVCPECLKLRVQSNVYLDDRAGMSVHKCDKKFTPPSGTLGTYSCSNGHTWNVLCKGTM